VAAIGKIVRRGLFHDDMRGAMKRQAVICAAVVLLALLFGSLAAAQSLGDLARQEKAKRAKQPRKPAKVYTNDNLPARPPGEGPTAASSMSYEAPPPAAQPGEPVPIPGTENLMKEPKEGDKQGSKELWQGRFKAAKQQIDSLEDAQRLSEDELSLLQIQHARELDQDVLRDLEAKIRDKTAEVEAKRAQTEKAKKALEDLEKEFKESGAPADWSKTE
jgi:hypothetical protein